MKKQRGITLIALVITIIVLLILAGVTINAILGDEGIISRAKNAQENMESAKLEEELNLMLADMKIGMLTEGTVEGLDDLLKGLYKFEVLFDDEAEVEKLDGIFETSSGLARATLVITWDANGNETLKFENVKAVSEVPDIAIPIYLMMINPDSTEIEEVDYNDYDSYSVIGIRYKNVVYDVFESGTYNSFLMTISVREDLATKTWKNVFADYYVGPFALDSNDKLWLLTSNTTATCLNNVYPEFNDFVVKDAIYMYNYVGRKEIVGFIGTNGKIYLSIRAGERENVENLTDLLVCLNDEFSSEFGGIKAEEVIPVGHDLGIVQVEVYNDFFYGYNWTNYVIRDVDGKIWLVEFDYYNGMVPIVKCLNSEISELNNVKFKQMVVSGVGTSEDAFVPCVELGSYFSILGLDNNNKLWKIQNIAWDYENDTSLDYYKLTAKNLVETDSFPLIKSIDYSTSGNYSHIIDESGNVYDYYFTGTAEEINIVLEGANIEEYNDEFMLANDGTVYRWESAINADYFDGKTIKDIYEYQFALAEDGTIYLGNWNNISIVSWGDGTYSNTLNVDVIKSSSINSTIFIVGSDGKIYIGELPSPS